MIVSSYVVIFECMSAFSWPWGLSYPQFVEDTLNKINQKEKIVFERVGTPQRTNGGKHPVKMGLLKACDLGVGLNFNKTSTFSLQGRG